MTTLEELKAAANELCQKHWGIDFTGEIEVVKYEWSNMNGQFRVKKKEGRTILRFSAKTNKRRGREATMKTLLHELVHWRLYTTGIPHKDGTETFVAECLRVGASFSQTRVARAAYERYMESSSTEEEETE